MYASFVLHSREFHFEKNRVFILTIYKMCTEMELKGSLYPIDTGRKVNVHNTFRRRPGRILNLLCTFNERPVSTG